MKRMSQILYSFGLLTLLILSSCGKDETTIGASSAQSALNGECVMTSEYSPVCGANDITYDNISIARCYKVTQTVQGNCICTERPVCGDDGVTYSECRAQDNIRNGTLKRIIKFADCRSR